MEIADPSAVPSRSRALRASRRDASRINIFQRSITLSTEHLSLRTRFGIQVDGNSLTRTLAQPGGPEFGIWGGKILPGREVTAYQAQILLRSRRTVRFDAHSVVDGKTQFLLAAEVTFRRLDRDVSKQKLDLVQFATGKMAEPRAATSKIMRREFFNSGTLGGGSDDLPQYLGRHACTPDPTRFVDRSKERAFGDATGSLPFIDRYLHP